MAAAAILDNFEWPYLCNSSRSTYIVRIAQSSLHHSFLVMLNCCNVRCVLLFSCIDVCLRNDLMSLMWDPTQIYSNSSSSTYIIMSENCIERPLPLVLVLVETSLLNECLLIYLHHTTVRIQKKMFLKWNMGFGFQTAPPIHFLFGWHRRPMNQILVFLALLASMCFSIV